MFDRIRRLFSGKSSPVGTPPPTSPVAPARQPVNRSSESQTKPSPDVSSKPVADKSAAAKPVQEKAEPPSVAELKTRSPESVCGIDPKTMDREQIRKRLAELYRRHNQAASSLNEDLRNEAEFMLDAIVTCRNKYVG